MPKNLHDSLKSIVPSQQNDVINIGCCRDTMFFGEFGYKYSGGKHDAKEMNTTVIDLLNHVKPKSSNPDGKINDCQI